MKTKLPIYHSIIFGAGVIGMFIQGYGLARSGKSIEAIHVCILLIMVFIIVRNFRSNYGYRKEIKKELDKIQSGVTTLNTMLKYERQQKQSLVDICFSLPITLHYNNSYFKDKDQEFVAEWVRRQLAECGFPTVPIGSSHGVLLKSEKAKMQAMQRSEAQEETGKS